jgi:hypothetical protein
VVDIRQFDLSIKLERIRHLVFLIRLGSVLSVLKDIIPDDGMAEYIPLERWVILLLVRLT